MLKGRIRELKYDDFLTIPPFSHYKFSSKSSLSSDPGEFGFQVKHIEDTLADQYRVDLTEHRNRGINGES